MHHLQVGPASESGAGSESPTAGHQKDPSMLRERTTLYRGSSAEKLWLPPHQASEFLLLQVGWVSLPIQ